jgi:hypothetical protein
MPSDLMNASRFSLLPKVYATGSQKKYAKRNKLSKTKMVMAMFLKVKNFLKAFMLTL